VALAKNDSDIVQRLYSELLYITYGHDLSVLVQQAYNRKVSSSEEAKLFLLKKCYDMYVKLNIEELNLKHKELVVKVPDAIEIEFLRVVKHLSEFDSKVSAAVQNMNNIENSKPAQLVGRQRQLEGLSANIADLQQRNSEILNLDYRNSATKYYTAGINNDYEIYVKSRLETMSNKATESLVRLEARLKRSTNDNEKTLIAAVIKVIARFN